MKIDEGKAVDEDYEVVIVGAGMSGLGMAARLKEAGRHSFRVLEKASSVGGTWRDNTYPGAACDVQSHLYWYSFGEQPDWSHVYAEGRQRSCATSNASPRPMTSADTSASARRSRRRRGHRGRAAGPCSPRAASGCVPGS